MLVADGNRQIGCEAVAHMAADPGGSPEPHLIDDTAAGKGRAAIPRAGGTGRHAAEQIEAGEKIVLPGQSRHRDAYGNGEDQNHGLQAHRHHQKIEPRNPGKSWLAKR